MTIPRALRHFVCHLIAALLAMLHLAEPARAANSGGSTSTDCGPDYIGVCSTDSDDAAGGDVWIDTAADVFGMMVAGGYSDADGNARDNKVRVGGSDTFTLTMFYGGYSCSGNATGNSVAIGDRATLSAAYISGGQSCGGNATDNTVVIDGRTMISDSWISGGEGINGIGNTIIVGDHARVEDSFIIGGASFDGDATGNRVILQGSPVLTGTAIYGGMDLSGGPLPGDTVTGNVLEIRAMGLNALAVGQFAEYHYVLPAGMTAGIPAITLDTLTDLGSATIKVDIMPGTDVRQPGARFTLMRSPLLSTDYATPTAISGSQGFALNYDMVLEQVGDDLTATVQGVGASEQSKAPLEGRAVTIALNNQGADLIAGAAMSQARTAARENQWTGFGAVGGDSSRYASGSHVDVKGSSVVLGATRRFEAGWGPLIAGAFVEAGHGRYDSTNTFAASTVRGHGRSRYYGAGLMARQEFGRPASASSTAAATPTSPAMHGEQGLYLETSMRFGRITQDWSSPDLRNALGRDAAYDSSATYYGAHVGIGHVLPLGMRSSADLYAKYFWTRQGGDDVRIADDPYEFGTTNSHRTRLGARISHAIGMRARVYLGAAWEHEFDGRARATAYGFETPSPSLRGDTGLFELGLELATKKARAMTINVGLQGYTGKRQGVGGSAQLRYAF